MTACGGGRGARLDNLCAYVLFRFRAQMVPITLVQEASFLFWTVAATACAGQTEYPVRHGAFEIWRPAMDKQARKQNSVQVKKWCVIPKCFCVQPTGHPLPTAQCPSQLRTMLASPRPKLSLAAAETGALPTYILRAAAAGAARSGVGTVWGWLVRACMWWGWVGLHAAGLASSADSSCCSQQVRAQHAVHSTRSQAHTLARDTHPKNARTNSCEGTTPTCGRRRAAGRKGFGAGCQRTKRWLEAKPVCRQSPLSFRPRPCTCAAAQWAPRNAV